MLARTARAATIVFALFTAAACTACGASRTKIDDATAGSHVEQTPVQGLERGMLFPDLVLPGRPGERGPWQDFSFDELRDPNGERGVSAIYVVACSVSNDDCKEQLRRIVRWSWGYGPRGARFVAILAEGAPNTPPTKEMLDAWLSVYRAPFPVLLDVDRKSVLSNVFPTTYLVDPRSMRVVLKATGVTGEGALCKSDVDCCDPTHWSCATSDARCSTTFGACVSPFRSEGPMPELDALLEKNGAAPIEAFDHP